MRVLALTALAAALLAGGALPTAAATATATFGAGHAAFRATPVADDASDRDSLTAKAESQMRDWQRKLDDAAKSAKAQGQAGGDAASRALDHAWAKTKAASHHLETASAAGWDSAKAEFEKASRDLAAKWHKLHPGDE